MALKRSGGARHGIFEYGDVYDYDRETGGRSPYKIARLFVDDDNKRFYLKSEGSSAKAIPPDRVGWMIANNLIDFDAEEYQDFLLEYLMRLDRNRRDAQQNEINKYVNKQVATELKANNKLVKKTRRRARLSRFFWMLGCLVIVGLGVVASIPDPEPAPAEASIAGVGMIYPVNGDLLTDATYMQAIGNAGELYGIVVDNTVVESGQANAGESPVKENVLVNAAVSQTYPIHMRPLYYDRSSYYQSQIVLNDAEQGSSGILMQNPSGYALGLPANEIVLFGGRGMSSIVISSPEEYKAASASETASDIEQAQGEAIQNALNTDRGYSYKPTDEEYIASEMPSGWCGYDSCDIDSRLVAASYWYTRDSSGAKEDLKRRIVLMNIDSVYNLGESGVREIEPMQLNYQDNNSDFYAPVVSMSPSSNGSDYWLGYMKRSSTGAEGFFIRKYENAEDILLESYDNTFSTKDLTGTEYPITNYTLHGDRLFFEQQGYIWTMDLSKASIEVDGNQRMIKKENPIRICKASEIRPTVSRDEQFLASVTNSTTVPVSHYQVVRMTTSGGSIIYGIAFIESDTGNLVFQPCNGASVSTADLNEGAGADRGSLGVGSADEAAVQKALEEEALRNGGGQLVDTAGGEQSPEPQQQDDSAQQTQPDGTSIPSTDSIVGDAVPQGEPSSGQQPQQPEAPVQAPQDTIVPEQSAQDASASVIQGSYTIRQAVYTLTQVDGEETVDNGRILIKEGLADSQIICFCVRGEQFYWLEQDAETKERRIMCSPIYYKNDASQISSEVMEEIDENGEIVTDGVQPGDESSPATTATPDVLATDPQSSQQNGQAQDSSGGSVPDTPAEPPAVDGTQSDAAMPAPPAEATSNAATIASPPSAQDSPAPADSQTQPQAESSVPASPPAESAAQ